MNRIRQRKHELRPDTAELRIRTASDGFKICVVADQANSRKPRRKWILAGADAWDVDPPDRFERQHYPYGSLESAEADASRIFPSREEFLKFLSHRVNGDEFYENEFSAPFIPKSWLDGTPGAGATEPTVTLFDESRDVQSYERPARPGQQAFKRAVLERYGAQCSFCRITSVELLDGAHIIAWAAKGADVPENGLPLCKLHHSALDCGLIRIDPETLDLSFHDGIAACDVHVEEASIRHLPARPSPEALAWLFANTPAGARKLRLSELTGNVELSRNRHKVR